MRKVELCVIRLDKGLMHVLRTVEDDEVKEVRALTEAEYFAVAEAMRRRYRGRLTRILGINSLCLTFDDVDKETVNQILKYGKPIKG